MHRKNSLYKVNFFFFLKRIFSTLNSLHRDLMKWCQRIYPLMETTTNSKVISSVIKEGIFVEAFDCFCAPIPNKNIRHQFGREIAKIWDIPDERVNFFLQVNKPRLSVSASTVTVGRTTLPLSSPEVSAQLRSSVSN